MDQEPLCGTDWRLESNGHLRLGNADAAPSRGRWLYMMQGSGIERGRPFLAAARLRTEVLAELGQTAVPINQRLWLSLRHAIVLYPKYITPKDIGNMVSDRRSHLQTLWMLHATLPLANDNCMVELVIDSAQAEAVSVKR